MQRTFQILSILSTLLFTSVDINAQAPKKATFVCNYYGKAVNEKAICNLMGFTSKQEANEAVANIVKRSGLKQNFYVMECPNTDNCFAVTQNGNRLIVYDGAFMKRVNNLSKTDWGALSILAHEIGHHLQGHTIIEGGSDPTKELEADEFSGFVMYQMGAGLKDAQAAIQKLTTDYDGGTHPPRSKRLQAIQRGYQNAKALYPNINPKANNSSTKVEEEPEVVENDEPEVIKQEENKHERILSPRNVENNVDKPMSSEPQILKVEKKTGCIDGNCNDGLGTAVNKNTNEKYMGEWANGKRNGKGVEYYADGIKKYEGNYKDGTYHGNGTYFFTNGDRYVGKFKNGLMNGDNSVYYYKNGDRLVVKYIDGKKQGKAKILYRSGSEGTKFYKDDEEQR